MNEWSDQLAGARMQVDQQFQDRVMASQFSNQQWGLIMTAVDWEIRQADDPEAARLVADTSSVPDIIPELDRVQQQMGGAASPGGSQGGGGIAGRLKDMFGAFSGGSESDLDEKRQAAEALVEEYARELQSFLENQNRWDDVRTSAAEASRDE